MQIGTFDPATQNYAWVHVTGEWAGVASARVQSASGFVATELAVQTADCQQWATVDLGSRREVGMLRLRWWSAAASQTQLLAGNDSALSTATQLRVRGRGAGWG